MTLPHQIQTNRQLDHDIQNLLHNANIDQKEAILRLLQQTTTNIDMIIRNEAEYKLLRPLEATADNFSYLQEFLKTFVSIGINEPEIKSSADMQDPGELDEFALHINRYGRNYKDWLGKKLFLSKDEIEKKTIEDIDNVARKYINYAIQHVGKYLDNFSPEEQKFLKSEYYGQIHNGDSDKTVFNLLRFWNDLRLRLNTLIKEYQTNPRKGINYENVFRQINIGIYEIQRIMGLALLYIDREKNQNYQHTKEDIDFLVRKLSEITTNSKVEDHIIDQENPLYHITNSQTYYWGKKDGEYYLSENEDKNTFPIRLESIDVEGKIRNYKKGTQKVKVYHAAARMKKGPFSSVDKFIRKDYKSFDQIMDNKGFIFVVESFDDAETLRKIIENELGTLQSSWIDEPVYMQNSGNENSSSHYNSLKGTIKIPYKGKLIKDFFDGLEKHFRTHGELMRRIKAVKETCTQEKTPTIKQIEALLAKDFGESEFVKELFNDLKSKFKNKEYNIEVEIQIFDIQNYIKAEVDELSPAHHNYYKNRQVNDTIPKYLPASVYGYDLIKNLLLSRAETKK